MTYTPAVDKAGQADPAESLKMALLAGQGEKVVPAQPANVIREAQALEVKAALEA